MVLPLVVLAWATLSLLGGTTQTMEGANSQNETLVGLSLCTVTVAMMLGSRGMIRLLRLRPRWSRTLTRRPGADFRRHRGQSPRWSLERSNARWTLSPEFRRVLLI